MSAVPFTERELRRAWRELLDVAKPSAGTARKNPHRLLLFYAVECGLKAVWLKDQRRTLFDYADITRTGHNLRGILKDLKVGADLSLPENLQLRPVTRNGADHPRHGDIGMLHQAWRYGAECVSPIDQDCEKQLLRVAEWIQGKLK